jgi:hypothetical protein
MGALIYSKRTRHHSYNERDLFLDGKLELNKTPNPNMAATTEFIPNEGRPRVQGNQVGASST